MAAAVDCLRRVQLGMSRLKGAGWLSLHQPAAAGTVSAARAAAAASIFPLSELSLRSAVCARGCLGSCSLPCSAQPKSWQAAAQHTSFCTTLPWSNLLSIGAPASLERQAAAVLGVLPQLTAAARSTLLHPSPVMQLPHEALP